MSDNVEYRTGDLFDQDDITALCHGVNVRGLMGAGIAAVFRNKYPDMFTQYQTRCAFDGFHLGQVMPWWTHDGKVIFNLATQYLPGPHASLRAIETSLDEASRLLINTRDSSLRLGLPRIGAGIGGLQWDDVDDTIHDVSEDYPEITYVVVTLPE